MYVFSGVCSPLLLNPIVFYIHVPILSLVHSKIKNHYSTTILLNACRMNPYTLNKHLYDAFKFTVKLLTKNNIICAKNNINTTKNYIVSIQFIKYGCKVLSAPHDDIFL